MTHRDHMHPIVGGLGKKVERPKEVKPKLVPTETPGVFKDAETGRLETMIPVRTPDAAWPFDEPQKIKLKVTFDGVEPSFPVAFVRNQKTGSIDVVIKAGLVIKGDHD